MGHAGGGGGGGHNRTASWTRQSIDRRTREANLAASAAAPALDLDLTSPVDDTPPERPAHARRPSSPETPGGPGGIVAGEAPRRFGNHAAVGGGAAQGAPGVNGHGHGHRRSGESPEAAFRSCGPARCRRAELRSACRAQDSADTCVPSCRIALWVRPGRDRRRWPHHQRVSAAIPAPTFSTFSPFRLPCLPACLPPFFPTVAYPLSHPPRAPRRRRRRCSHAHADSFRLPLPPRRSLAYPPRSAPPSSPVPSIPLFRSPSLPSCRLVCLDLPSPSFATSVRRSFACLACTGARFGSVCAVRFFYSMPREPRDRVVADLASSKARRLLRVGAAVRDIPHSGSHEPLLRAGPLALPLRSSPPPLHSSPCSPTQPAMLPALAPLLLLLLASLAGAAAQQVTPPSSLLGCLPAALTIGGGVAPYTVSGASSSLPCG